MRYTVPRPRKLTAEKVTLMRALRAYNPKVYSCQRLGGIFNVGHSTAWKVITGRNWALIPFPNDEDAQVLVSAYFNMY